MEHEIKILDTKVLSHKKYMLKEVTFTVGSGDEQKKEVYVRGNSAGLLMYNIKQKTVILTRQLRLPTFLNGNNTGMLVECCAGMMNNGETAEACISREAIEETGYRPEQLEKVAEVNMSPASVLEQITLFIAPYAAEMKVAEGGGLKEEHEEIEVLEMDFEKAFDMMGNGGIRDGKTIILLQHLRLKGIM